MIKHKNILITGAAGFIGSHLTEKLLKYDNYLVLIDNFNKYYQGKEEQLNLILKNYSPKDNYQLIKGDLVDESLFSSIDQDFDYIFHLAAQAGVRYSIENALEISNNNIMSTINLFEFCLTKNTIKNIVYASSSSVYGNPNYTPVDENHPKRPISPYAVSKLCGELYADYYYRECNLPITSLRFYTVYGPRARPDMAIRKFFDCILNNKEIIIYGDGTQIRDFTYISDIIDGLTLAAENAAAKGQTFNLGCSNPIDVNNLVDQIYNITNAKRKVKFEEKQKGDVEITYSDISKAKKMLGYEPKIQIDIGLKNQFEWQKKLNSDDRSSLNTLIF